MEDHVLEAARVFLYRITTSRASLTSVLRSIACIYFLRQGKITRSHDRRMAERRGDIADIGSQRLAVRERFHLQHRPNHQRRIHHPIARSHPRAPTIIRELPRERFSCAYCPQSVSRARRQRPPTISLSRSRNMISGFCTCPLSHASKVRSALR